MDFILGMLKHLKVHETDEYNYPNNITNGQVSGFEANITFTCNDDIDNFSNYEYLHQIIKILYMVILVIILIRIIIILQIFSIIQIFFQCNYTIKIIIHSL